MTARAPEQPTRVTPTSPTELVRRLDWRQEALSMALVLAECALVYLATGLLLPGDEPVRAVLPAWIVVMLLVTAHLVPHLMDEWRVWSPQYEAVTGVAIAGTLLIAIKAASFPHYAIWDLDWLRQTFRALAILSNDAERTVWGIVILAAYAWWRGRAREAQPGIDAAYSILRWGTFVLAFQLILILAAAPDDAQVRDRLSIATLSYFICALAGIGAARLKLEGFRTSAPLGPRWLATFVAPILAVVVVAIIGAGIFSRQFLDTLLWLLSPVFWFLAIVFQAFVLMMAVLAFLILTPIFWLIGTREPRPLQATPAPADEGGLDNLQRRAEEAINVPDPLRYLIAGLILFLIFSVLARFVFHRRRRQRESTDEERESVLEWGNVLGSAMDKLRGMLRRPERADPLAHLRDDPRWRHTLAIRETYRQLQSRGAKAGRPRRAPETADEYAPGLSTRLAHDPAAAPNIATITQHYDTARYSGAPATESDARAVAEAWRRVERVPVEGGSD